MILIFKILLFATLQDSSRLNKIKPFHNVRRHKAFDGRASAPGSLWQGTFTSAGGEPDKTRGGLSRVVFPIHAPPDVPPNTRILAVCSIPDTKDVNQASASLRFLAARYLASHPSNPSAAGSQAVHSTSLDILEGKPRTLKFEKLYAILHYRLNKVMAVATEVKNVLGIAFPDCEDFDIDSYEMALSPDAINSVDNYRRQIHKLDLFEIPVQEEGKPYLKGLHYLAYAFETTKWNKEQVWEKLKVVDKHQISGAYRTMKIHELHKRDDLRQALREGGQEARKRLRSMSLVKKQRKPLPLSLEERT